MIMQSVNGDEYQSSVHNVIRCVLYALDHKCSLKKALYQAKHEPYDPGFLSTAELMAMLEWDGDDTVPDDCCIGPSRPNCSWEGTCVLGGWSKTD